MKKRDFVKTLGAISLFQAMELRSAFASPNLVSSLNGTKPIVNTIYGPVIGKNINNISVFKGIPYAIAQRFKAPIETPKWTIAKEAFDYGASSPQSSKEDANQSEDCLYLNIWSPKLDNKKRAVMFYIHGGAYSNGSGSHALYDGTSLAEAYDVVVVTINHRLNAFGYLYLAHLERLIKGTNEFAVSGNAGQLDIIAALKWVKQNIINFGGNPNNIMVFGQSGGGAKIASLMATPIADGLFQKAATMSGQQVTASGPNNATARSKAYLEKLGIAINSDAFDKIKAVSSRDLVAALSARDPIASGSVYFGPVLDNQILFRHPFYPDAAKQSLRIPMIIGNTQEETMAFLGNDPNLSSLRWEDLPEKLPPQYRVDINPFIVIEKYRKLYPDYTPAQIYIAATTAGRSWRGAIIELEERAKAGAPAYGYNINWASSKDGGKWGSPHTIDIALAFKNTHVPSQYIEDNAEARLMANYVSEAFVSLAKTGKPSGGFPKWKLYTMQNRETMIFDIPPKMVNDPRGEERKLFEQVPFIQHGT